MTTMTLSRPATAQHRTAAATGQPRWARPAFALLLLGTAGLYLWGLSATGMANSFYSAAVQAGTQSWKALLFGSLDPGNIITVDKPPASLWVMGLSGRIFGFSSWSMLAPQALEGVASVALLYATLKRRFGPVAGLIGGAALAVTPVAVLMFRYNLPDALLVLLLVAGAYCTTRAVEKASVRWLALAGVALGFAFLTKMLQGFLVLPAFALAYLVAAPTSVGRRVLHLMTAGAALVLSAGWFVALVALWPASSRPYIGGSTNNSLLELALGYNGLGRIFGGTGNPGGGGGGGMGNGNVGFGGATGITRLFGASMGAEISWLLPTALIALVAGLWFTRRAPRTDQTRAALIIWGGWLLVTGVVFSYMSGITHPYYTVALAPAIAALVAIGVRELWRARSSMSARAMLALLVFATVVWDFVLLSRDSSWLPLLRWAILIAGTAVAAALLLGADRIKKAALVLTVAGLLTGAAGASAWAVATADTTHSGSIPMSGPAGASGFGGMGGGGMGGGGMGGGANSSSSELTALLKATTTKWAAATSGATSAADLELASGKSVIAIGGWDGSDPAPTLAQFKQYVADGEIGYFISGGRSGGGLAMGSGGGNSEIASWVQANFTATTVGNTTVYKLTK